MYIMASGKRGTLYTGIANDIVRRVNEHRDKINDVSYAKQREKQLKNWHSQLKENMIEKNNPNWNDLYESLH